MSTQATGNLPPFFTETTTATLSPTLHESRLQRRSLSRCSIHARVISRLTNIAPRSAYMA